ncbi:MAG: bifunctional methylenetetrahydrofolate dehydrogenase/methenyltetrahydrofolate cyclohydrolase FolD [Acidiferrobacterales bacterium]|nr:bifunctional methylenetetrahydrofolate dehydrogenase/methenyltetrahydrofolate cyclohydrolase FolD [Acidiferrobacterales bacterium]
MAKLIDGKALAANLRQSVAEKVNLVKTEHGLIPGLAVVLVGDSDASQVYVRNKIIQTAQAGMNSFHNKLASGVTENELLDLIERLNCDPLVHGILVQLPLPDHINAELVIGSVLPQKDVDGFHAQNVGLLTIGMDALVPCTPLGCIQLLKSCEMDLNGMNAVIVGRSNIVGKPLATLLLKENCTVTVAHSRTRDLETVCSQADILVSAVGKAHIIKGHWVKPGATVIDVGINRIKHESGKMQLVGDVDFAEAEKIAGAITPVPGGVGPMTIACLLQNALKAACNQHNVPVPD